jgi:predicted N-acetyltransferase YhbS
MLTIRQARETDCQALCAVQRAAIVRHYSRKLGEADARARAELVDAAALGRTIEAAMVIVAEEGGSLLGFAQFDAATGEIELSCSGDAEQRAIPAALLAVIETEARSRGLGTLNVHAMLGTESLFTPSGFGSAPRRTGQEAGDGSLPTLKLEKRLVYAEPRPERRRNGGGKPAPR